jgi:hypothetical protein
VTRSNHTWSTRLAAVALLGLLLPATGWTWGSVGHHYVATRYSQHLPPFIDGLRLYDSTVDSHVTDADSRKSYTPGEEYKHYIDIDSYAEFFAGTLTHDRAALEAQYGASVVQSIGVLPWAIGEAVTTLTTQFQAQSWSAAALTIADLCHYVGDANQPLHCTKNYNGQFTDNYGIHSRYESSMLGTYAGQLGTPPMDVTYYANAVDAAFADITSSWAGVEPILDADSAGFATSGGSYNSTYYATLWNWTKSLTQARLDTATVMTASLVYSAWQDAGRPTVPNSSAEVPPLPQPEPGVRLIAGPSPCRDVLTVRFAGTGPLSVDVFDVRGARVARLADGVTGEGSVTWRPGGAGAGPGLYFVRLRGPAVNLVRRVSVIG